MKKILIAITILILSIFIFNQQALADGCNSDGDCKDLGEGWYCLKGSSGGFGECQPPDKGLGGGKDGRSINMRCSCTSEFGDCGDNFGKTDIQWRQCQLNLKGTEICNWIKDLKLYQIKDCDSEPTPTGNITPTGDPTPTVNANCKCNALNNCTADCTFNKIDGVTYNNQIKCSGLANSRYPTPPITANKNDWCRRPYRVQGDADGNDKVNLMDYFYFVAASHGAKIPARINADFNGDGKVNGEDRVVIIKGLKL